MRGIERRLALTGSVVLVGVAMSFGADSEAKPVSAEGNSQKVATTPSQVLVPTTPTPDVVATQVANIRATITALASQEQREKEIADLRATVTALQGAIKTPEATPTPNIIVVPVPAPNPTPDVLTISRDTLNSLIDKGVSIALTAQPTPTTKIIEREIVKEKVVKEEGWFSWRSLLVGGAIAAGAGVIAAALSRRVRVFVIERLGGTPPPPPPVP